MEPYSIWAFGILTAMDLLSLRTVAGKKALIICSGGMDSVVAATKIGRWCIWIGLVHFGYGSRAGGSEQKRSGAGWYRRCLFILFQLDIYGPKDSPLLQHGTRLQAADWHWVCAGWVPARNLVMLAMATAFAEARGIGYIVLGNNLEEAGAYPDNEPEFINRFNDLLPFAVGDGKRVKVVMPVGNYIDIGSLPLGMR